MQASALGCVASTKQRAVVLLAQLQAALVRVHSPAMNQPCPGLVVGSGKPTEHAKEETRRNQPWPIQRLQREGHRGVPGEQQEGGRLVRGPDPAAAASHRSQEQHRRVNPLVYQQVGDSYAIFAARAGARTTSPDWYLQPRRAPRRSGRGRHRHRPRPARSQDPDERTRSTPGRGRSPRLRGSEKSAAPRRRSPAPWPSITRTRSQPAGAGGRGTFSSSSSRSSTVRPMRLISMRIHRCWRW